MWKMKGSIVVCAFTLAGALALGGFTVRADHDRGDQDDHDGGGQRTRKVFVIAMENHNWTQPAVQALEVLSRSS